jgi:hypothetical protein
MEEENRSFKIRLTEIGILGTGRKIWTCKVYEENQYWLEYEDGESTERNQAVEKAVIKILDKLQQTRWPGGSIEIHYYKPSAEADRITKKLKEFKCNVNISLQWSAKPLEYPLTKQEIEEWVEMFKEQLGYREKE